MSIRRKTSRTPATFIDVDGDLVTVKFSKPIAQQVLYATTFGAPSITGAKQLLRIDLSNVTPAAAAGVYITFTAVPKDGNGDGLKDGDGKVNVGEIRAVGKNLGAVSLPGDLGSIELGTVKIGGDVRGAFPSFGAAVAQAAGVIESTGPIASLSLGGSLLGRDGISMHVFEV